MPHEYDIVITGDDHLHTRIYLTDDEFNVFMKVVNSFEEMGPYAPAIIVKDLTAEREKALEAAQRAVEEERCKFPTAMQMAFQKAEKK